MDTNKIIEIPVDQLFGHPNNPRKNVGDVTELAESIKANGLMQNLTVVPGHIEGEERKEYGYTVIIGHRRLAAAKKAGLQVLPCAVRYDMPEKEQIATMIGENMQRVDLTIVEQAQSMQMMIDLGDTVEQVSEKTGLSKSTVRNRLKIAALNPEALKKSEARQISIGDYMKLMDIEDESTRNAVLLSAGTNNFSREYDKAIRAQNDAKTHGIVEKYLIENGYVSISDEETRDKISTKSLYNLSATSDLDKEIGKPKTGENFYSYRWGLTLYRNKTQKDREIDSYHARARHWREEKENQIDEITEEFYSRLRKFFSEYSPKKEDAEYIQRAFMIHTMHDYADKEDVAELLGIEDQAVKGALYRHEYDEALERSAVENPTKTMVAWLASYVLDQRVATISWQEPLEITHDAQYRGKKKEYLHVCDVLENIGFDIADEEREFIEGTHPIYDEEFYEPVPKK